MTCAMTTSTHLQLFRTFVGLAFGLAIVAAAAANDLSQARAPALGPALSLAGAQLLGMRRGPAEVAVRFDSRGRIVARALTRSSGSRAADQRALKAALELASLHRAASVAGRTLVFRASFAG